MPTSHTPGPWKIDRYFPSRRPFGISQDLGNKPGKAVTTSGGFARKSTDEAEANARLIAAAPDMLEALEYICEAEWDGINEPPWAERARAAIAKAKGEA